MLQNRVILVSLTLLGLHMRLLVLLEPLLFFVVHIVHIREHLFAEIEFVVFHTKLFHILVLSL